MMVLITGANGFVGRNLAVALGRRPGTGILGLDVDSSAEQLDRALAQADIVFHLAGVNRPEKVEDFEAGNAGSTESLCRRLHDLGRAPTVVLSSSIQAESDNPYGRSKLKAETVLRDYAAATGARAVVFRLKNLFGKWCRPHYNSVTATFCHQIARGLPITVSNDNNMVDLTYIDDVVSAFVREVDGLQTSPKGFHMAEPLPSRQCTLGELAGFIRSFHDHRTTLRLADFADAFTRRLYATYLSYLERDNFAYALDQRTDNRGALAEFVKQPSFGQVFVSRTRPGITRGNHYHDTKCEKFMVVEGQAVIRFRHIQSDDVIEYPVNGEEFRVVDIPPGYTHSIENIGQGTLVTLFWSTEVFDQSSPDTYFLPVLREHHTA